MRIVHRIGLRATASQRREIESLGLRLPAGIGLGGGDPLLAFDISEDHPNWELLSGLFRKWGASDITRTEFSRAEIEAAQWLNLVPEWHYGYPQPDADTFGYRKATYDLSEWCADCGIGLKQKAPFQMTGEPKWGRIGILQLNWIFDEFFVTPQVWNTIFKPQGIACRPVIDVRGLELKTVLQLTVIEQVGVLTDGLPYEVCPSCNRTRYLPVTRGAFPALATQPASAMAKTSSYFGSGASAHKYVLVSGSLARNLVASKVRGVSLRPVDTRNHDQACNETETGEEL